MPIPGPLDLMAQQRAQLARQSCLLLLLGLAVCGLVGILGWKIVQGTPVHLVPPGGPGLSQPGVIPDSAALDFAARCLVARYSFTPASLKIAHVEMRACLHPTLHAAFKVQAEKETLMVKEGRLTSMLLVDTAQVTTRTALEVTVALTGFRTVFIGGQQVRDEPIQALLTIIPLLSQGLPSGLVITKMHITPPLSVSGT